MKDTKKMKVYLDVDSTVIKTTDYIAKYYNNKYHKHPDFKEAIGSQIYYFNAHQECPLLTLEDVEDLFSSRKFFEEVEIYEDCIDTLLKLEKTDRFIFKFISIGTTKNIANKVLFLEKYFPFVKQGEMLVKNFGSNVRMGKDKFVVDGLLIDDHDRNLNNSAMYEIMFKGDGEKDWNKDFKLGTNKAIVSNWNDMEYIVEEFYEDWRQKYE